MTLGPTRFVIVARAMPMIAAARSNARTASGFPLRASWTASRRVSPGSRCASLIEPRMAADEATVSTQPRRPHEQTISAGASGRWPISPATPCAPSTTSPFRYSPQPIPVPIVTIAKESVSTPMPNHSSAMVRARTSLSTTTGIPSLAWTRPASGTSDQFIRGDMRTTPVSASMSPDTTTPVPMTFAAASPRRDKSASATAAIPSTAAATPGLGSGRRTECRMFARMVVATP